MRLLVVAVLLVAAPAWAGLPVAYDADYATLKKDLAIGDPLHFSLYETPTCLGAPVFSEILGAGSLPVTIEQVSPVPAGKQKPPKIERLREPRRTVVAQGRIELPTPAFSECRKRQK